MTSQNVLVVDDDRNFLHVVSELLQAGSPPYAVFEAESGSAALRILQGDLRPAFVVLDFHLPDMNAVAVLRRLRAVPDRRALPVLVMSEATRPENNADALAAGATRFIPKPSEVSTLRGILTTFAMENADAAGSSAD